MPEESQSERHSSDDRGGTVSPKVDAGGRMLVGLEQTKDVMWDRIEEKFLTRNKDDSYRTHDQLTSK
ncbi:unnamed protein product [Cuscuta campestris]|uniref:Uncharacterized protein n=1 Tax=Cuscuta campestris TaxID=132261 RepID=A0A484ML87_9ASTE|nr:unnamed protein product [Cuscuta campestris]